MAPDWIKPEKQIEIINSMVMKNDTFVCLGDVGKADYIKQIKACRKILLLGNHDRRSDYIDYFDEIYTGPLFISDKLLLSHEPVYGLPWCLNIHGHDHNNMEAYRDDCKHINLAANVCGYTPVNLGKLIKNGMLADICSIHRVTIDKAVMKKKDCDISINSISEEEAIELLEFCEDETSFVEKYIPSMDVRKQIESDNWIFSDRDKAAIIWNSDKPYSIKHADLIRIMNETDNQTLKGQISERIRFDAIAFRCFDKNRRGFVYVANTNEFPGEDNIIGYFDSMKAACHR